MNPDTLVHPAGCRRRLATVRRGLREAGVDAVLITAPAAVAALTGVWIETGTVMPERQPWLLLDPNDPPRVLVHEYEQGLAMRRRAAEQVEVVAAGDRVAAVRRWRDRLGRAVRLGIDGGSLPASTLLLEPGHPDVSGWLPELLRGYHPAELARVTRAAADVAAAVAEVLEHSCAPEREHAAQLAAALLRRSGDWYDVVPIVSSGSRLQIPHARPTDQRPADGDLCRIGLRARYGPYHLMCVRAAVARGGKYDPDFGICGAVARDAAAVVAALRSGISYAKLESILPPRTNRFPMALAQGMGFSFKEPPTIASGREDTVSDGDQVLVSVVLTDPGGARAYWQTVTAVGAAT